jgi:hypothetical protein
MTTQATSPAALRARRAIWIAGPALVAALLAYAYFGIGWYYFDRFSLDLGSQHFPSYRELHQISICLVFGAPIALLFGLSLARALDASPRFAALVASALDAEDRTWIAFGGLAAFLFPVALRMLVLDDGILVDDEHLYRFEAQLIAGGHLTTPSPPLKLFFDQSYLINDGRMYAMYFVGWPALMAPGVWLGVAGYMNAVYCALTVPPLFFVLRALTSSRWAKIGTVLYATSPIVLIGAATQMSHTSGMFALACMAWCLLLCEEHGARGALAHAGVAASFSLAFFIRPTVAIGIGLPMLVVWALGVRALPRAEATRALLGFGAVAVAAAAAFLLVDKLQTGSFLTTAYARDKTYAVENGSRFSLWGVPGFIEYLASDPVPQFQTKRPLLASMAEWGIAMLRMNYNAFGWPFSFAFVPFARGRWTAMLAWTFVTFSAVHFFVLAPGVDTYGPHHYIELALPLLILTVIGAHRATEALAAYANAPGAPGDEHAKGPSRALGYLPGGVVIASVAFALATYMPARVVALWSMSENAHEPEREAAAQNVHHALVFSARPFTSKFLGCAQSAPHHNVYWHPVNDPGFKDDVIWANHINVKDDARLLKYFPDRQAFVMVWLPSCKVRFLPIEKLKPGDVPDGLIGGNGKGLDETDP